MKLHTFLYKAARVANDVDAVTHPRRLPRRLKNKAVGRTLGRTGFWRGLWR
jgi:hypothetical protein